MELRSICCNHLPPLGEGYRPIYARQVGLDRICWMHLTQGNRLHQEFFTSLVTAPNLHLLALPFLLYPLPPLGEGYRPIYARQVGLDRICWMHLTQGNRLHQEFFTSLVTAPNLHLLALPFLLYPSPPLLSLLSALRALIVTPLSSPMLLSPSRGSSERFAACNPSLPFSYAIAVVAALFLKRSVSARFGCALSSLPAKRVGRPSSFPLLSG